MDASTVSPAGFPARPSLREALRFWAYLGFVSFGGPAGQIATLHREIVEKRKWMSEERFTSGLAFCTFLPGPEAQQLATYIGWSLHGIRGGLFAGILFFLPAAVILLGLSYIRAAYGNLPLVSAVLFGLRPIVVAIILDAVLRMAGKRFSARESGWLAAAAFAAAFLLRLPFPAIVAGAALAGLLIPAFRPVPQPIPPTRARSVTAQLRHASLVLAVGLLLWALPWAILLSWGDGGRLYQEQYAFSPRPPSSPSAAPTRS